jgi:hypothetical protein
MDLLTVTLSLSWSLAFGYFKNDIHSNYRLVLHSSHFNILLTYSPHPYPAYLFAIVVFLPDIAHPISSISPPLSPLLALSFLFLRSFPASPSPLDFGGIRSRAGVAGVGLCVCCMMVGVNSWKITTFNMITTISAKLSRQNYPPHQHRLPKSPFLLLNMADMFPRMEIQLTVHILLLLR